MFYVDQELKKHRARVMPTTAFLPAIHHHRQMKVTLQSTALQM